MRMLEQRNAIDNTLLRSNQQRNVHQAEIKRKNGASIAARLSLLMKIDQ